MEITNRPIKFFFLVSFTISLTLAHLTLGASTSMAYTNITCSNSDASLQFKKHLLTGGAHPYRGMVIERTKWVFNGETIGEYEGRYLEPTAPMDLEVQYDDQSRVNLKQEQLPHGGYTIYAVRVALKKKRTTGEHWSFNDHLICRHNYALVP